MKFNAKHYAIVVSSAVPNLFDSWKKTSWGCTYLFNGFMAGAVVVDEARECLWDVQDADLKFFESISDAAVVEWCRGHCTPYADAMDLAASKVMNLTIDPDFDWDLRFSMK